MNCLEKPMALGRTAEIYAWQAGKVLKLFFPSIPLAWIDQETDTGRYIQATPLPVPKVYERVKLHEREGLIYERIEGPSLLSELGRKPWTVMQAARLLARLHAQVHEIGAPPHLETQRDWARGGIIEADKLPHEMQRDILCLLDSLPDGNQLCHGDFHPGNLIITPRGPIIIDWMTASKGTAAGDVARTSIILEVGKAPDGTPARWLIEWVRSLFLSTYLRTYFQLHPAEKRLFAAWRAVMAANFLRVSMPEEELDLTRIIQQGLGGD